MAAVGGECAICPGAGCRVVLTDQRAAHVRLFAAALRLDLTESCSYLTLPYFPVALDDALRVPGIQPLSTEHVRRVFRQVIEGLNCEC